MSPAQFRRNKSSLLSILRVESFLNKALQLDIIVIISKIFASTILVENGKFFPSSIRSGKAARRTRASSRLARHGLFHQRIDSKKHRCADALCHSKIVDRSVAVTFDETSLTHRGAPTHARAPPILRRA